MEYLKTVDAETTEEWLVLDGPLFLFGGEDLTGEFFTPETDSRSAYTETVGRLPIDAEHGFKITPDYPGRDEVLGYVDAGTIRDEKYGRLARHLLDRRNAYVQQVFEPLARAGLLGSSSEAAPEGVAKDRNGHILRWPLKRQSLTVEPAEPRLLSEHQLEVIKSLGEHFPALKTLFTPTGDQESATDTGAAGGNQLTVGENTMSELEDSLQALKAVATDMSAAAGAMTEAAKAFASPPSPIMPRQSGVVDVVADENVKRYEASRNKGGELLLAVKAATILGGTHNLDTYQKAILGANESVPSEGGFLVGTDRAPGVDSKEFGSGVLMSRAALVSISNGANSIDLFGRKENSRADGSRHGGMLAYRVAEGGTITASEMLWYKYTLKPAKYAVLSYGTDEILADSSLTQSEIFDAAPKELNFKVDDDIMNGVAAGYPRGILGSTSLVEVAKDTGQAAATITTTNVINMWARRWVGGRYVWFVNQNVLPQLMQMSFGVGTGGIMAYLPPGGLSAAPYATLLGAPVIETEFNPTLGTVGDILLADMSQYKLATVGGVQAATSIHVQFLTDQTAFRWTVRYDGQSSWQSALTPYKGTGTISPFVALATRA